MEMLELYYNSHTKRVIDSDLKSNMINHGYLLVSGGTTLIHSYAKFVASEFFCKAVDRPCGKCSTCTRIEHSNYSDVIVYPKDDKTNIMTEDINNIVLDEYVLPYESDKKVYILFDFDNATVQAQNKLLKTLEEPNKSTIFVLTASNLNNVLPTIRSRCKIITEGALANNVIKKYLFDMGVEQSIASVVADKSFGNLTYALNHASQSGKQIILLAKDIFNNMTNSSMVLKYSNSMYEHKGEIKDLISQMLMCVADMTRLIAQNKTSSEYDLSMYNMQSLQEIAKLCEVAQHKIQANASFNSVTDGLLLGILEVRYKWQK